MKKTSIISEFRKTPEEVLEETLEHLIESFNVLSTKTTEFSSEIKEIYSNDLFTITNHKINEVFIKFKDETKSDLSTYHDTTINDCDGFSSNVKNLLEYYNLPYHDWCLHEALLQKTSEEFKNTAEGLANIHEGLLNRLKKRAEHMNKAITDIQESTSTVALEAQLLRNRQHSCQQYSCSCIVLYIPRRLRNLFRYLSSKVCGTTRSRNTSYETLVRKKESVVEPVSKHLKLNEDAIHSKTESLISLFGELLSGLRDVSNGVSYIHQDLCRLDYHEANKERHYEIMAGKSQPITRLCRQYIASLATTRLDMACALDLFEDERN